MNSAFGRLTFVGLAAERAGFTPDEPGATFFETDTLNFYYYKTVSGWTLIGGVGPGSVSGTGVAGRVTIWTGVSTVSSDAGFLYDAGTDVLTAWGKMIAKPAATAGIGLDPNGATGNFSLWLSPANLTADRRITFGDANFSFTGGGTLALGGFTLTVGGNSSINGTAATGSGAANQVAYWSGANTLTGLALSGVPSALISNAGAPSWMTYSANPGAAAAILASNASGYLQLVRLGLGVAPSYPLHVNGNAGIFGTLILDVASGSSGRNELIYSYSDTAGTGSAIIGYRARGSVAIPAVPQSGDVLITFGGSGYSGAGWLGGNAALVQMRATETWSAAANGTQVGFITTANGTDYTTRVERMTIHNDGSIVINESGVATADVRIEGDTNVNLFMLDASADAIGVGVVPTYRFDVSSGTTDTVARFASSDNNAQIIITDDDTPTYWGGEGSTAYWGLTSGLSVNNVNLTATGMSLGIAAATEKFHVVGNVFLGADNNKVLWGAGKGASIYYDGTNMSVNPKEVGTGWMQVDGQVLTTDKLLFTQTDGNEYIDSLNDGYMDYGATTLHRFNNPLTIANIKAGADQAAAGAAAGEIYKTSGHATLPDNVLMIGV